MKIHEFQAKQIFAEFGVAVPKGRVARSADDARAIAQELGGKVVVKAQIHAGGRGKGGGVKLANSPDEAASVFSQIMGMQLVTHQTGPQGQKVKTVLVEEQMAIERELYLAVLIDSAAGRPVMMASAAGGMEIEEVAAKTPEKILRVAIDPATGMEPFHARKLAFGLGLTGAQVGSATKFMLGMYQAFTKLDCSIVEINPLVVTGAGAVIALDAKMNFDDNALDRHKDVADLRDEDEEDPAEREAAKHGLNYIKLSGNIGCMVNGAGLAMATMDIIKYYGGNPANFLDVGGGASREQVTEAFKIILRDANVQGILVNIFGGIMQCDVIAAGILDAAKVTNLSLPLVVRLEGNRSAEGKKMIQQSGLKVLSADSMADAAQKIVQVIGAR